jgi:UDP-N-acetylglucosamine acyltransferase
MSPFSEVHATAVVAASARLGAGVRVGPHAVIEEDTDVGEGTELRSHVVVKRFTAIGKGNTVHEAAILGGEPQDVGFTGAETRLRIGDGNRIREGVTIHRATRPGGETVVGSGCFLMAYAHVAHECVIGDGALLANNVALAGHVDIGARAFLSGGVVVHQFCRVGRLAMIGGNSKIVQDCLPFVITDGVPGRARGLNVVGLRRAGVAAAQLRTLKEGYRLLLRSSHRLETALERMSALDDPWVDEMIAFVRGSARGFHHAARNAETAS